MFISDKASLSHTFDRKKHVNMLPQYGYAFFTRLILKYVKLYLKTASKSEPESVKMFGLIIDLTVKTFTSNKYCIC